MTSEEFKNRKDTVCICDVGIVGDYAIMSNDIFNALIVYDLKEKRISSIERFMEIEAGAHAYHSFCEVVEDSAYFFPRSGNIVNKYDKKHNEQKIITLKKEGEFGVQYAHVNGKQLYLFPFYGKNKLISLDFGSDTCAEMDWWECEELLKAPSIRSGRYADGKVWNHCVDSNLILITDVYNETIDKINIDIGNREIHFIEFDGESFLVALKNSPDIYEWSKKDGLIEVYNDMSRRYTAQYPYKIFVCVNNEIFVFLRERNELLILDKKSKRINKIADFPEWALYPSNDWTVYFRELKDTILLFCYFTNFVIAVDKKNLNVRFFKTSVENSKMYRDYYDSTIREYLRGNIIHEGVPYDWKSNLDAFIENVCELD